MADLAPDTGHFLSVYTLFKLKIGWFLGELKGTKTGLFTVLAGDCGALGGHPHSPEHNGAGGTSLHSTGTVYKGLLSGEHSLHIEGCRLSPSVAVHLHRDSVPTLVQFAGRDLDGDGIRLCYRIANGA